uniref:ATP synthase complex subunit 8 n=1 Tax=Macratriinae sp. 2 ACP-2013 TaxID=1434623 RepID=A0A3G3ME95_9CUCU|nr:ATP synthase F0 subunit 8 [Macratriinae sp. 2 ACP-2013]
MPQMAPLNWLTLMIFFIILFLMFNVQNFYSFNYKNEKTSTKQKKIIFNWKW